MFAKESEMTRPAADWLASQGMAVKAEFVVPWGHCDLVAARFNPDRVAHRLRLKQTRPIGSDFRAMLLCLIPEEETETGAGGPASVDELVAHFAPYSTAERIGKEVDRLVKDRFVRRDDRGELRKLNGWAPIFDRLVAVELKLSRVDEVMRQAGSHLGFAGESYVGLPAPLAERVAAKPGRWSQYLDDGVGILAVNLDSCRVLAEARPNRRWTNPAVELHCADKFWALRATCS